jgi:uncharacterized protein (TIGR03067 family)
MRRLVLSLLLVTAGFAGGAPAPFVVRSTSQVDLKKMQGAWVSVYRTIDAKVETDPDEVVAVIAGDRVNYLWSGQSLAEFTLTLNAEKHPRRFDLKILKLNGLKEKDARGRVIRGLYRLNRDTLTICMHRNGDYPGEFRSGQGHLFEVFKRWKR